MIVLSEKLVYLHPSKTAGTSVEQSLMAHVTGFPADDLPHRLGPLFACWDSQSTQHLPYRQMLDAYPFVAGWRKIVTVRHPYTRMISEFKYHLAGNCVDRRRPAYSERDINRAVINGLLWNNCFTWHGQPQVNYLGPDVEILRFESLAADWQRLIGFCPLNHANRSDDQQFELSDRAKEVIQQRFEQDFAQLGYLP